MGHDADSCWGVAVESQVNLLRVRLQHYVDWPGLPPVRFRAEVAELLEDVAESILVMANL